MNRWLKALLLFSTLAYPLSGDEAPSTIAFASCALQDLPQPIWKEVKKHDPELVIMMGDNIYADHSKEVGKDYFPLKTPKEGQSPESVRRYLDAQYQKLANKPHFKALFDQVPFIATWDDHDFGRNDVGKEYAYKEVSKKAFLNFWKEPKDSSRWHQKGGIYTSYLYGEAGKRLQVILLDSRYERDAQFEVDSNTYEARKTYQMGPYLADPDPKKRMLGDTQWAWLERELQKPADLRLIVSSVQVLADFSGWESWALFPKERERLLDLAQKSNGVLFLSGDVHWAELSHITTDYPLWEATSSGINERWEAIPANRYRVGKALPEENYGILKIDWKSREVQIHLHDQKGALRLSKALNFDALKRNQP